MYQLAFIYGDTLIYWHAIILALSILTGIVFFLAAYQRRFGELSGAAVACPIAIVLSLLLARLAHWYFRPDSYDGLLSAMTDLFSTGYALLGIFAGCMLTGCLLALLQVVPSLPGMLDCLSLGGCAAIALGRLSNFFTPDDRGEILESIRSLPIVWPVTNATSGQLEYRLATFLFQSIAAGCIFAALLWLFHANEKRKCRRDGDIALLFLLLHCTVQVVLESTRYDCLRLRSNGFISIVQVLSAIALAAICVDFSVRLLKKGSRMMPLVLGWLLTAGSLGCAGYMEYYVQRHGDKAVFCYSIMSACMAVIAAVGIAMFHAARETDKQEVAS